MLLRMLKILRALVHGGAGIIVAVFDAVIELLEALKRPEEEE